MKKTSLPNRVISVALSTMLAFTLVPSAAFAANAGADANAPAAEDASAGGEAPASDAVEDAAPDAEAAPGAAQPSAVVSEERAIDAAAQDGQPATEDDAPEMVRAAVAVQAGDAADATLVTCNGLSFRIGQDAEGTATATLVGLGAALEGALEIPAAVTWGDATYAVTNISSRQELRGGGPRLAAILLR